MGIKKFKVPLSALVGICTSHMKMLKAMCERTDRGFLKNI